MNAVAEQIIPFNIVESLDSQYLDKRNELEQVAQLSAGTSVVSVDVAGFKFAVEVGKAVETIRFKQPQPLPRSFNWVLGLIELRGEVIPVVDFAAFNKQGKTNIDATTRLLVIRHNQTAYAMLVSGVSSVFEITDFYNQDDSEAPTRPSGFAVEFEQWVVLNGEKTHFMDLQALEEHSEFLTITF